MIFYVPRGGVTVFALGLLEELARNLRREPGSPVREGAIRPGKAPGLPRPIRRRRRTAARSTAPRSGKLCERFEPSGGAHQQGDDRDSTQICQPAAGESCGAQGQSAHQAEWRGAQGLAEDVRYYGQWMRNEAEKRIGHLYPKVEITAEMAKSATT
jgi:hypothetical protein